MRLTLDLASRSAQLYRDGHWCPPELAEPYVQLFSQMTALMLPEPQASAPPVCLRKGSSLEQRRAVQTALTAPLSYVTAAAGCGKTGFVLASSLVSLLMAGRKVLLTAPTNYALDSAMRTVLGALGEDARRFCPVRLGCAGEDFQQDYGWVARIPSPAAALVGVTLDKLAQMLASGLLYQPDHIFLDEAAYAPLIKVLPLLRFPQARLTLLGDHHQLPPVCTIPASALRLHPDLMLWKLPSTCLGSAFELEPEALDRSPLLNTAAVPLTRSYRYGGPLAQVLSQRVYGGHLVGAAAHGTEIEVLDAPSEFHLDRTSLTEASTIQRRVQALEPGSFAVLTPYHHQADLLRSYLDSPEAVRTIHSVQGMEWDTVLLSVADARPSCLTDSQNSSLPALEVLNTAVSRARKRLIIVCNVSGWKNQRGQLLSELVSIGLYDRVPA